VKKFIFITAIAFIISIPSLLSAENKDNIQKDKALIQKKIVNKLNKNSNRQNLITDFSKSKVHGLYRVEINGSQTIYATEDGKHFINGDLFQSNSNNVTNLTELKRNDKRRKLIDSINLDSAISFKPKEKIKKTVIVFTDTDCYYCRKLHKEIADYKKLGIEVKYLAYPRSGIGKKSKTYKTMSSIWCSKDKNRAMTRAKKKKRIKSIKCENPVKNHYKFAKKIGVRATPAILFESGELHMGYLPAKILAKKLNI